MQFFRIWNKLKKTWYLGQNKVPQFHEMRKNRMKLPFWPEKQASFGRFFRIRNT